MRNTRKQILRRVGYPQSIIFYRPRNVAYRTVGNQEHMIGLVIKQKTRTKGQGSEWLESIVWHNDQLYSGPLGWWLVERCRIGCSFDRRS